MILIPVIFVGLEHNGVLLGGVGHQIRTVVGDVVRILAIQVGLGFRVVLSAKLTALAGVIVTAQRGEHAVTQHGGKEGAGSRQGIFQSQIIQRLDAHGREISGFSVHVSLRTRDVAAFGANQVFQAFRCVHHVLHAGDPVVRLDVGNLAALAVHPHGAFTDGEGVGQAVLGHGVTGGQSGLLNVFFIVFIQAVIGVDDGPAVRLLGGGQHIPGIGIAGVGIIVYIRQLVALAGQVFLGLRVVFAGAVNFVPQGAQRFDVFRLQHAVLHDDHLMHPVRIVAPQGRIRRTGSNPGNPVLTAPALQRNHHGGAQDLGLGNRHQGIPEAQVIDFLLRFGIVGIEITQHGIVDLGGGGFIGVVVHFGLRGSRQLRFFAHRHAAEHGQGNHQ